MDIYAQVLYGIREEGAKTISDILLRRMHTGITASRGEPQAAQIAGMMARELGWNAAEQDHWVKDFKEDLMKEKRF
jgi:glycerol-3-phosphate dehydrogenase